MIIIDLFNLLYYKYDEVNLKIITNFISTITLYSDITKKRIFVIFDGVYFQSSFNSMYKKVELYFINGKADDYIIKLVKNAPSKTYFVVTADREIINFVNEKNKDKIISPNNFWKEIFEINNIYNNEKNKTYKKSTLKKLSDVDDNDIDDLMNLYTENIFHKD